MVYTHVLDVRNLAWHFGGCGGVVEGKGFDKEIRDGRRWARIILGVREKYAKRRA